MNIIRVIDFSTDKYINMEEYGYDIIPGDMDIIKSINYQDTSNTGIIANICNRYVNWRLHGLIVFTIGEDEWYNYLKYNIFDIETPMQSILDYYSTKDPEYLMINLIPHEINKYRNMNYNAELISNIYIRYGFINIDGHLRNKLYIPEYVMLRWNSTGACNIIGNRRDTW